MRALIFSLSLLIGSIAMAQDDNESNSLQDQYNDLKAKSNNYQIYKVVKETSLDAFWASAKDSLKIERSRIQALQTEVNGLNKEVAQLQTQVSTRDEQLAEQEHQIEHMSFLGASLTKSSYITLTWAIIFALLIAAVIFYVRFYSANSITSKTRAEMQQLQEEFEHHRQRTRDNETKLKRDLQTEINRVEELKAQLEGNT